MFVMAEAPKKLKKMLEKKRTGEEKSTADNTMDRY